MMEFLAGIVVGAAFSPFWMMVWNAIKPHVMSLLSKKTEK